jgi:hypothetical protein
MTSLLPPPAASVDDGPAIAELHRLHALQRTAFLAGPYPAAAERKGHLGSLADAFLPSYGGVAQAIVDSVFAGPGGAGTSAPGRA